MTTMRSAQWLLLMGMSTCLTFVVPQRESTAWIDDCDYAFPEFPYYVQLSDDYTLRWKLDDTKTKITFFVDAKTTGWVGFGLSPNGNMPGSDVVVGWVNGATGKHFFKDCYAETRARPVEDASQDWKLEMARQINGRTQMIMSRALDTCDNKGDRKIVNGTTRVIWAYGAKDPDNDVYTMIRYHQTNRGVKSLLLLDPPLVEQTESHLPDDTIKVPYLMDGYDVPVNKTTYACRIIVLPPEVRAEKHHLIRWAPKVDNNRFDLIHHMVLYYCLGTDGEYSDGEQHLCYNKRVHTNAGCERDVFLVWAVGGTPYDYPQNVGHPMGGKDRLHYFKLEVHYDNIRHESGIKDSSGIILYLTKTLRPMEAGLLQLGVRIDKTHVIPPHFSSLISRGYCDERCLKEYLSDTKDNKITVFGGLLHTHLAGVGVRSRHFRKGIELEPILEDEHYDFDYQETRSLHTHRVILPGDSFVTDCDYKTVSRNKVTYGGFPTEEEMCLVYLYYYPEMKISACLTSTLWEPHVVKSTKDFNTTLYNWTESIVRDQFVTDLKKQRVKNWCYGLTTKRFNGTDTDAPALQNIFKPVNKICPAT